MSGFRVEGILVQQYALQFHLQPQTEETGYPWLGLVNPFPSFKPQKSILESQFSCPFNDEDMLKQKTAFPGVEMTLRLQ
jgi:hypothetical protein